MGTNQAELIDTGEKRGGRGRRLVTAQQRMELVEAYQRSGLTQAAFARREGVIYSTFAGWVHRSSARKPRQGTDAPVRFAEVNLSAVTGLGAALEVRLPDGTVLRGSRAAELAELVRALRA
jgi:transposase-like protein